MREVFAENFSFIAQFSLTLWLFKVLGSVQKFLVYKNFFDFQGPLHSDSILLILLGQFPDSRPRIVSEAFRTKS